MKKLMYYLFALFCSQLLFSQAKKPKAPEKCPPPQYKKGQTSAQVNEDTRNYIACRKQVKEEQEAQRRDAA